MSDGMQQLAEGFGRLREAMGRIGEVFREFSRVMARSAYLDREERRRVRPARLHSKRPRRWRA